MTNELKIYVHLLSEYLLDRGLPSTEEIGQMAILAYQAAEKFDSVERQEQEEPSSGAPN